jgi:hypothetical protein
MLLGVLPPPDRPVPQVLPVGQRDQPRALVLQV